MIQLKVIMMVASYEEFGVVSTEFCSHCLKECTAFCELKLVESHCENFKSLDDLKYDDEITGFYVKHLDNSRSNLSVNQIFKVSRNVNVVFKQESNDSLTPNLTT